MNGFVFINMLFWGEGALHPQSYLDWAPCYPVLGRPRCMLSIDRRILSIDPVASMQPSSAPLHGRSSLSIDEC
jgi:hypothetical protein